MEKTESKQKRRREEKKESTDDATDDTNASNNTVSVASAPPPLKRQKKLIVDFSNWLTTTPRSSVSSPTVASSKEEKKEKDEHKETTKEINLETVQPKVLLRLPTGEPAVTLYKGLYRGAKADALYQELADPTKTTWTQKEAKKFQFKKAVAPKEPRYTTGFSTSPDRVFEYSGQKIQGVPFTSNIQQFVDDCYVLEKAATTKERERKATISSSSSSSGETKKDTKQQKKQEEKVKRARQEALQRETAPSNFVFGNNYKNWKDEKKTVLSGHHISAHPDAEKGTDPLACIWSLSLGSPRRKKFMYQVKGEEPEDGSKRPNRVPVINVLLEHGDVLCMHARPSLVDDGLQQLYEHYVPAPTKNQMQEYDRRWPQFDQRFNLTGRTLL